jgi:hypothetical protein
MMCVFYCFFDDNKTDRTFLLTDGIDKTWYIYSSFPEGVNSTCDETHIIQADNTYIFYSNGTFEFDHGEIVEDTNCTSEDCCSDLVNITGKWKLRNNDKKLRIVAEYETGNKSNALQLTLFDATIDYLDENVLKLSQVDSETNVTYTYEFRKR